MISTFSTFLLGGAALFGYAHSLEVGEYYRPMGDQVSGYVGANTAYVRSPCPALNTLANHGYLPRDGKNITHAELSKALRDIYNLGDGLINLFVSPIPEGVSLSDLSKHNLIEHEVSIVHNDVSSNSDPAEINTELWLDFLSHAKDGKFGVRQLADVHRDRIKSCYAKPTGCDFGTMNQFRSLCEAGLLMRGLGGHNDESISVEYAKSFLVDERIPENYTRPPTQLSVDDLLDTAGKVQLAATFQDVVPWIYT